MKYELYLHYIVHSTYVITTEVNFITPAYRYTQWPVHPMLNVNWSTFLEGILPTPSHDWNIDINRGHQLVGGDPRLSKVGFNF